MTDDVGMLEYLLLRESAGYFISLRDGETQYSSLDGERDGKDGMMGELGQMILYFIVRGLMLI